MKSPRIRGPALGALLAAAVLTLAACGSQTGGSASGGGTSDVKVLLNTPPSGINAELYYAQQLGYFKQQHLNVTIEPGTSSQNTIAEVAANKATVGFSIPTNALTSAPKGSKVVSVGTAFGRNGQGVFVAKSAGATSLKQLTGKTILELGASFGSVLNNLLQKQGVSPGSNHYVIVSSAPTMIQSYVAGRGDAVITQIPYGLPLIQGKRPSTPILESSYGLQGPTYNFFVNPSTLQTKPDTIKRFLTATYEGFAAANKNPAAAGQAESNSAPEVKATVAAAQYKNYIPYECSSAMSGHSLAYQPASDWTSMAQSLVQIKSVPSSLNVSSLYTNQFESAGKAVMCPLTGG